MNEAIQTRIKENKVSKHFYRTTTLYGAITAIAVGTLLALVTREVLLPLMIGAVIFLGTIAWVIAEDKSKDES